VEALWDAGQALDLAGEIHRFTDLTTV